MLMFGGRDYRGDYVSDVWALSLGGLPAWTQLTPSGPEQDGRMLHSAVYDPVRDRMVVFGGWDGAVHRYVNDAWALSLAGSPTWAQISPTGTPPAGRLGQSAIYDPVRDRMVIFGGRDNSFQLLNDVWELSLSNSSWTAVTPSGLSPSPRFGPGAIYDPVRDRMVVFGGMDAGGVTFNDVWALSLDGVPVWTLVMPADTLPVYGSAVYDPVRDRMLVIRSADPDSFSGSWALPLTGAPVWDTLLASGPPPDERGGWSTIYDTKRDRVVTFGGYSWQYLNDVWALWLGGVLDVSDSRSGPSIGSLSPPSPNPSRGTARLSYSIPRAGPVQLGVYDVSGHRVRSLVNGERRSGAETVVWNGVSDSGSRLASGVYFIRLVGPGVRATRKVILLR
jgi:hypothetical protein